MPSGPFPSCDKCGQEIPALGPFFRLSHCHLVMPKGKPEQVTGSPEHDLGFFCSTGCLRGFVDGLGDDAPKSN